jgi:hypothetical protein
MVLVLEPRPEDMVTKNNSTLKLDTEDVLQETQASFNAEDTEVQTKMTSVLKLMLDAQVNHMLDQHSEEPVKNSPLMEDQLVTFGEKQEMENGDH